MASLSKTPERAARFQTSSGIPLDRLYLVRPVVREYPDVIVFPGEFPYTRGGSQLCIAWRL
jgi:methylmalonyl-CoA mutase N-terminal domain/subunit